MLDHNENRTVPDADSSTRRPAERRLRPRRDTVAEWRPSSIVNMALPRSVSHVPTQSPFVLGLIGTGALHTLVLASFWVGICAHSSHPPNLEVPGAAKVTARPVPSETLMLLDLPKTTIDQVPITVDLASQALLTMPVDVMTLDSDALPQVRIPPDTMEIAAETPSTIQSGDPAIRLALLASYTTQVDARIERAWRRPRSPVYSATDRAAGPSTPTAPRLIADEMFKCRVRILQDAHGAVQDVQMVSCNGSPSWQQSLMSAIRAASPLPSAPHPSLMAHTLTMTFTAAPYVAGSSQDDYEVAKAR